VSKLGGETPSRIRAWSLIRNEKNNCSLWETLPCNRSQRPLHIACARRCRSSRLTRWWTKKNNRKKWKAEEEERHRGRWTKKKVLKEYHVSAERRTFLSAQFSGTKSRPIKYKLNELDLYSVHSAMTPLLSAATQTNIECINCSCVT
jgi:hypothetical protein